MSEEQVGGPESLFGAAVRYYADKTDTTVSELAFVRRTTIKDDGDIFADLVIHDASGDDGNGSSYRARVAMDGPTVTATEVFILADQAPL